MLRLTNGVSVLPSSFAPRPSIICDAEYLGLSTTDRLRERFPRRSAVEQGTVDLARSAWSAFRAADPTAWNLPPAEGTR